MMRIVQSPVAGDSITIRSTMFSKSGSMVVWIDRAEPKRPCKIEFDLSFGKLVASLKKAGSAPGDDFGADWEHWGD